MLPLSIFDGGPGKEFKVQPLKSSCSSVEQSTFLIEQNMFIFMISFISCKMNLPFRLGAERTLKSFYNNSLLNNTLLSIIEAKMFIYSCSFIQYHT